MKYNPVTRKLTTKHGHLIKRLHCPKNANWRVMTSFEGKQSRLCSHCEKQVLDIKGMTGGEVRKVVQGNSKACLKLELGYSNIRLVTTDD